MTFARSRILGFAIFAAAVAFGWPATSEFFVVDACLDSGGSFDYSYGVCDLRVSHPYAPSSFRSPWVILLSTGFALVGLWLLAGRRSRSGNRKVSGTIV